MTVTLTRPSPAGWGSAPTSPAGRTSRLTASVSAADEPGVRADRAGHRAVGADDQRDPVGDVEAGVPAGLLDDPDHVPGGALGRQLRGHRGVQRDQPVVAGQRRGRVRVGGGQPAARTRRARSCDAAGRDDVAVGPGWRPVARLDRPDDLLHLGAEPRPEQPAGSPPARTAPRLAGSSDSSTVLDVDLVRDQVGERGQRRGVAGGRRSATASGSRTRSWRALRRPSAALQTARARSIALGQRRRRTASRTTSGQSSRCTLTPPVRPRQIVSAVSGSSGAAARQYRLEHGPQRVERGRRRPPRTGSRPADVPVGQHLEVVAEQPGRRRRCRSRRAAAAISLTAARVFARMYRSRTCGAGHRAGRPV